MPSNNNEIARQKQRDDHLIDPLMRSFMYGQFANLFKFAYWWVALSPLLYSITDNSSTAIGIGRIVYNTALCLASPLGPLIIEHISPRTILLGAAGTRFIVWSILLPLNWIFFESDLTNSKSIVGVYAMVVVMLIFDGFSVGLSSVLDIDFMGVDILAGFLGRDVTEEHRNQFNSRNELFFAVCFIIFSPAMAFVGLGLRDAFDNYQRGDDLDAGSGALTFAQVQSGTLSAIFVISFLIATIIQFYYFWGLTPENADKIDNALEVSNSNLHSVNDGSDGDRSMGTAKPLMEDQNTTNDESPLVASPNSENEQQQQPEGQEENSKSVGEIICGLLGDLKESFFLVISHRAILFRLIFFGFEIAFEDASIAVLAAQLGIHVEWLGNGDSVKGSIWTAVIVAVGKFGAAIASYLMMKEYHPPEDMMGHTKLFVAIGLSTLVILMIPAAFDGYSSGHLSENGARAITFVSFFLYFFLSTLPKLGLMSLLQTMVSQVENGHRAFAFIAIVATTLDSLIIMGLSLLFDDAGTRTDEAFSRSLWITTYVFLAHGLLETIFGPILILRPAVEDAQKAAAIEAQQKQEQEQEKQEQGTDDDNNKKDDDNNNDNNENVEDVTQIKPDLLADGNDLNTRQLNNSASNLNAAPSNLDDSPNNNQLLAGSYSARAVAMPVAYNPRNNTGGSTLNYNSIAAAGGSLSARNRNSTLGGGGVSPRLGGIPISPRHQQQRTTSGLNLNGGSNSARAQHYSNLGGTNNEPGSPNNNASSSVMRQNMLGRSMHSAIAASNVLIPQRSGLSRLDNDNNNAAGAQSHPGNSPSDLGGFVRRGRPSTLNVSSNNNNQEQDSGYGST